MKRLVVLGVVVGLMASTLSSFAGGPPQGRGPRKPGLHAGRPMRHEAVSRKVERPSAPAATGMRQRTRPMVAPRKGKAAVARKHGRLAAVRQHGRPMVAPRKGRAAVAREHGRLAGMRQHGRFARGRRHGRILAARKHGKIVVAKRPGRKARQARAKRYVRRHAKK